MWLQVRSTLYAGVFSCVLHIMMLGIAAASLISLPSQPRPQLRVTLLQRAVSLPVQEPPLGGAKTPKLPVPQIPPRELPRPKSVAQKERASIAPPRPPRPISQPKRLPPQEPPPIVKEDPTHIASVVPPQTDQTPKNEAALTEATLPSLSSGKETNGEPLALTNQSVTAGRNGRDERDGGGEASSPSATPDYNVNPKPPYPLIARRIGAQGEVLLRVLVRQDGSVGSVELARSSGFSLLDESATRTVRDLWRFIPAQLDGLPVESWVEVPIKFVLADS